MQSFQQDVARRWRKVDIEYAYIDVNGFDDMDTEYVARRMQL